MTQSMYDAAGGHDGLVALAHAWHERCLADPVAAHPFGHPGQHPDHTERLATYWGEALGGPPAYTSGMGDQSHVLRLHSGNGEHRELDDRAVDCFAVALGDVGLSPGEGVGAALLAYFRWGTDLMAGHPDSPDTVPDGLALPHWTWTGPVDR